MTIIKIILILTGITFITFFYLIYFKKKYNLINGFEDDLKNHRKNISYAKKVGLIELIVGIVFLILAFFI